MREIPLQAEPGKNPQPCVTRGETLVMSRFIFRKALPLIAAALAAMPLVAQAQASPPDADVDWRRANEAVGELRRGHADALKWEQANMPAEKEPAAAAADLSLMTADAVVRLAWRVHLDLATPLNRFGPDNVERIAAGRWAEVDPQLLRRVDDADEVLDVAAAARKVWLQAIAARQLVSYQREILVAAETAGELGQRMANVGNWSRLQQAQVQIALKTAQMDLKRAEYAAAQAQAEVLELLQLSAIHRTVGLPDALPELPAAAMTGAELEKRLAAVIDRLPSADGRRVRTDARLAFSAYEASHALALGSREVLKLREFVAEETVLHYNGMLKSVWELLDEVGKRSQAASDAVGSQRDFWIAEADLQRVLLGGAPASFVSLGGGNNADSAAAAH
jgi:hypothetical protein